MSQTISGELPHPVIAVSALFSEVAYGDKFFVLFPAPDPGHAGYEFQLFSEKPSAHVTDSCYYIIPQVHRHSERIRVLYAILRSIDVMNVAFERGAGKRIRFDALRDGSGNRLQHLEFVMRISKESSGSIAPEVANAAVQDELPLLRRIEFVVEPAP